MTNIINFFERVHGIKVDEGSENGYINLENKKEVIYDFNDNIKGCINHSTFDEVVQDAFRRMGIKKSIVKDSIVPTKLSTKVSTKIIEDIVGMCPECDGDLVIRMNRNTGDEFIGCSSFPMCKYTERL